jgi:hypothetical protein
MLKKQVTIEHIIQQSRAMSMYNMAELVGSIPVDEIMLICCYNKIAQ